MIFGSKQNKEIATRIAEKVAPVLGRVHTSHGLPTGFWNEPYALGYMMGQINGWMEALGGGDISIADKGRVLVEAFGILSGQKGKPISESAMVCAQREVPDFLSANQNGMFMAMLASGGLPDPDAVPAVAATRQELSAEGADPTPEAVVDHLTRRLWVTELRERMTIGA